MPFSRRRPRPRPPPAPQEPPPEWVSQRQLGASIPWVSTLEEKAFDDEWAAATADVKARHEAEKARERPPPDQKAIEAAEAKRDVEAKNFQEECDRILALDDGESILRWRGAGWVEDDPFNTPIGLGTRWEELNRKTPRMSHYIHRSCPWESLSPSCRAWFATWIPEAKAKAMIDSERNTSLWGVAVRRVIWEQLLSSERPDDLWLGPHWAAFGKVESELRSFEKDAEKDKPEYPFAASLYRHARFTYYRLLYALHGYHKDATLLKQRIYETISPATEANNPDTSAKLDEFLTSILADWLKFDLCLRSDARDVRVDWGDPETGKATGWMWREERTMLKLVEIYGDLGIEEEWPISWVERPLLRAYGSSSMSYIDNFAQRPTVLRYDLLFLVEPMLAHPEEYIYEEVSEEVSEEETPDEDESMEAVE